MQIPSEWREFIALLNSNEVQYLVVGAVALAYYGRPRYTGDIDIFIAVSRENSIRMQKVLEEFGFAGMGLKEKDFLAPDQVIQLGYPPLRIDILTALTGIDFTDAWERRKFVNVNGLSLPMLDKSDLIRNKKALGRLQDLADLQMLEATESSQ